MKHMCYVPFCTFANGVRLGYSCIACIDAISSRRKDEPLERTMVYSEVLL